MLEFSNLFGQFRNCFEKIGFKAVVCNLENRFVGASVDGYYDFGVLHSSQVLNSTWNTACDVKIRGHNLSCLTNLHFIRTVSWVNGSSWSSNCSISESICQFVNDIEVLFALYSSSSWDNNSGSCQVRFAWIWFFFFDELWKFLGRFLDYFNFSSVSSLRQLLERWGSECQKVNILIGPNFSQSISCICWSYEGLFIKNLKYISDWLTDKFSSNPGDNILSQAAA